MTYGDTGHDNAQVIIDRRLNQAAAQVLLPILLLTAVSIGLRQLWLSIVTGFLPAITALLLVLL